jgi:hypothetical protein
MEQSIINLPLYTKTKNGLDAVVFFERASINFPFLGMYFTEEQWYPIRWTAEGKAYPDNEHPLDLILMTKVTNE